MAITRDQIVAAIHKGFRAANRNYGRWSNGRNVDDSAIEGLVASCIAEAVHNRQEPRESLLMEMSFTDIRSASGQNPPRQRGGRRADIVICNANRQPTSVIEVKRKWNTGGCIEDIDRITQLVNACSYRRGGSLRRGFLAFLIVKERINSKPAKERVREQKAKIEHAIGCQPARGLKRSYSLSRFAHLNENKVAASLVVEVAIPNRR
ncbi:MAG: hypothetical protein F4Y86_15060 [Gammaproteobacteria bacterium]|nr:hypothetical protein [Gammaproteobacteria bacterium]MYB37211.1 hypothetical protein [Gammaproteobacteria bacterium]